MRSSCRLYRLVLVFFLISLPAFGQSSAYKPGAPLMMWKVSSNAHSAYLLGSVHLGDKTLYPLPSVIEDAFAASSVLIVEVDMSRVNKLKLQRLITAAGSYPEGDSLSMHTTPDTRAKLDAFLRSYGIPPETFAQYRPWRVGLTVGMLSMMRAGMDPNEGIDTYFLNRAGNKRIDELEDVASQLKLFGDFPEKDNDRYIVRCIAQANSVTDNLDKLRTFWSQGAADKIGELMASLSADESREERAFDRRLREDRNPHMTERLEKCLQSSSESCFMVVGAAHVIGSEGMVKQLQSRGYKVEQAVVESPSQTAPK
jgi:uncharacterized protein YbaP (TraB family)